MLTISRMKYFVVGKKGLRQDRLAPGDATLIRIRRPIFGDVRSSYLYLQAPCGPDAVYGAVLEWGPWTPGDSVGNAAAFGASVREVSEQVAQYLAEDYARREGLSLPSERFVLDGAA